jgi:hypothetical protein
LKFIQPLFETSASTLHPQGEHKRLPAMRWLTYPLQTAQGGQLPHF